MEDVNKKETEESSKELAHDHWNYIQKTLEKQNEIMCEIFQKPDQKLLDVMMKIIEYHYKTAFIHGYKHGKEDGSRLVKHFYTL